MHIKIFLITLFLAIAHSGYSQSVDNSVNKTLSEEVKKETIDSLTFYLNTYYIDKELAEKASAQLFNFLKEGKYNLLTSHNQFALALTKDIRSVIKDKHINVRFSAELISTDLNKYIMEVPPAEKEYYQKWLQEDNYGIRKIDVLKGNIGYISFNYFCAPEFSSEVYVAAMQYINHTSALIIDLRDCRGSASPEAIPFLASYFFKAPVYLNNFQWNHNHTNVQQWTSSVVPGEKYLNKPVYILTSKATFSGAEEFAYDFKNLGRATIIGDTTSGGANPGGGFRIGDHFLAFIPFGKVTNPITGTNWEGIGVSPDIQVNIKNSLSKAHSLALQHRLDNDSINIFSDQLKHIMEEVNKGFISFKKVKFDLKGYSNANEVFVTGNFNDWMPNANSMTRTEEGWTVSIDCMKGSNAYKFIVDGEWILDPQNKNKIQEGEYTNSVIEVK